MSRTHLAHIKFDKEIRASLAGLIELVAASSDRDYAGERSPDFPAGSVQSPGPGARGASVEAWGLAKDHDDNRGTRIDLARAIDDLVNRKLSTWSKMAGERAIKIQELEASIEVLKRQLSDRVSEVQSEQRKVLEWIAERDCVVKKLVRKDEELGKVERRLEVIQEHARKIGDL